MVTQGHGGATGPTEMGRDPKDYDQAEHGSEADSSRYVSAGLGAATSFESAGGGSTPPGAIGVCRDSRLRPTTRKGNDPSAGEARPPPPPRRPLRRPHLPPPPQHCSSVNVVPQRPGSWSSASPWSRKPVQLVGAHQRQQPLLQGRGELQRQSQVGMPGGSATTSALTFPSMPNSRSRWRCCRPASRSPPLTRNASLMSAISLSSAGAGGLKCQEPVSGSSSTIVAPGRASRRYVSICSWPARAG